MRASDIPNDGQAQFDFAAERDRERIEALAQTAIERIRMAHDMSMRRMDSPLFICVSGGKDSSVITQLAIESGCPVIFHHAHTTADAPETVYFVREEFDRLRGLGYEVIIHRPERSMWKLIEDMNGCPPLRRMRYCCAKLKEVRIMTKNGKRGFICTGVRWSESTARKERGVLEAAASIKEKHIILMDDNDAERRLFEDCKLRSGKIVNPIIDWSDDDVWAFLRLRNVPINPLYAEGWKRVGCVGCPMASTRQRAAEFERWPVYKRAYIAAFERGFEKAAREGHPNVLAMLGMGGGGCADAYELKQVASGIAKRYGERRFARWLDDRPLDDEDKKYIKDVLT